MKLYHILFLCLLLLSCEEDYDIISKNELKQLTVQDTLVQNKDFLVFTVGRSSKDSYPRLLVKKKNLYLFDIDSELKHDTVIQTYYPAFVIDSQGEFRENGIWVYANFYSEGTFPFHTKVIDFSVDSIPATWQGNVPNREGIYFYRNELLQLFSEEQTEESFKEKEIDGFYFIPNSGRLFNTIHISDLE